MTVRRALKSVNLSSVAMARMARMARMAPPDPEVILVQRANGARRVNADGMVLLEKMD